MEDVPPEVEPILLQRGVRQGDPLGPLFFAMVLQGPFEAAVAAGATTKGCAVHDDAALHGATADVRASYDKLRELTAPLGLKLRPQKCLVYSPKRETAAALAASIGVTHAPDGVVAAGAPSSRALCGIARRQFGMRCRACAHCSRTWTPRTPSCCCAACSRAGWATCCASSPSRRSWRRLTPCWPLTALRPTPLPTRRWPSLEGSTAPRRASAAARASTPRQLRPLQLPGRSAGGSLPGLGRLGSETLVLCEFFRH